MADLVTLAEAKAALPDLKDDTRLSLWIAAASAAVRAYCGRQALGPPEEITETVVGTGGTVLYTAERPITVDEDDAPFTVTIDGTAVDADGVTVYTTPGRVRLENTYAPVNSTVVLTYTAGPAAVPDEVKQAVYLTIEELSRETGTDRDLIEVRHRDYTERYSERKRSEGIVPTAAKQLLRWQRRYPMLV